MLRRTRLCKMTQMCLRREVRLLSSCTITSLNLNKCTQGWRGGLRIWGGFPRSKKAKKLPGRIARRERARKCHWLKNCVGVASRRCYLRLCSIVPSVFQLVWDTSVIPPTLTRLHFKKQQQQKKTWDIFLNLSTKMSFSCNQSLDGSFPPSPAEDRRSNRLSWGSLLQKLSELKGNNQRATADHLSSRSQTGEFLLQ